MCAPGSSARVKKVLRRGAGHARTKLNDDAIGVLHHRDTEDAEEGTENINPLCPLCVLCVSVVKISSANRQTEKVQPFSFRISSVSVGTTSNRSPTMP